MKKLSLTTHTLITEFVHGLAFVILGLLYAPEFSMADTWPDWLMLVMKVVLVILVSMPVVIRLFFKKNFDVWDETAEEHLLEAKDIANTLMRLAMIIVAVLLMSEQSSAQEVAGVAEAKKMLSAPLGVSIILTLYGAVEIIQSLYFIYLEKRGV